MFKLFLGKPIKRSKLKGKPKKSEKKILGMLDKWYAGAEKKKDFGGKLAI